MLTGIEIKNINHLGIMGVAFFTSLTAIACSSILIGVNLRCNTHFAKSLLLGSLEDYLDNIFKIDVQGDTRLDKAVERMVKQQQEFLDIFHDKVSNSHFEIQSRKKQSK